MVFPFLRCNLLIYILSFLSISINILPSLCLYFYSSQFYFLFVSFSFLPTPIFLFLLFLQILLFFHLTLPILSQHFSYFSLPHLPLLTVPFLFPQAPFLQFNFFLCHRLLYYFPDLFPQSLRNLSSLVSSLDLLQPLNFSWYFPIPSSVRTLFNKILPPSFSLDSLLFSISELFTATSIGSDWTPLVLPHLLLVFPLLRLPQRHLSLMLLFLLCTAILLLSHNYH